MRKLIPALILVLPTVASANYGACILEKVPGVSSREVFFAAVRACRDRFPEGLQGVDYGAGKGWVFSKYKNPDECLATEARNTTLQVAVSEIRNVCRVMYGEAPKPQPKPALTPGVIVPGDKPWETWQEHYSPPSQEDGPWMDYR